MTTTELALLGSARYEARITPLRSGGRRDVEVLAADPETPRAFTETDVIANLRRFFLALDDEAQQYGGDPVATAQALARLEALLADIRSVRDTIKAMTASALADQRIRRLTVGGVVTVEASTETKRTGWLNEHLLTAVLNARGLTFIDRSTGEVLTGVESASAILEYLRPDWRMTPLKEIGIDPDEFCEIARDDDGKPLREPSVRIVDNVTRHLDGGVK